MGETKRSFSGSELHSFYRFSQSRAFTPIHCASADVEEGISLSLVFENPLALGSRLVDLRFAEARGSKELDVRAFVTLEAGMIFSVAFHHKGKFVNGKKWQYRGGEIHVEHEIDTDRWSYFEAVGLVKDLGYKGLIKLWWKGKKESMKKSLKKLVEDNDAFELAAFAVNNKSEVDIYVEHVEENAEIVQGTEVNLNSNPLGSDKGPNVEKEADVNVVPAVNEGVVNVVPVVNEVPEVAGVNDMAGGNEDNELNYSSDGSVKGIHFSDSEEERGLGLDDGFDNAEIGEAEAVLNQQIENMKKNNVVVDMVGDGAPVKKKKTPRMGRMGSVGIAIDVERLAVNSFVPPNLNTMHAMDEEYNSDELDSELDDDNIDGVARPKYPTYNKEDMCHKKGHNSRKCKEPPPPDSNNEETVPESQGVQSATPPVSSQGGQSATPVSSQGGQSAAPPVPRPRGRPRKNLGKQPQVYQETTNTKKRKADKGKFKFAPSSSKSVSDAPPNVNESANLDPIAAAAIPLFEQVLAQVVQASNVWKAENVPDVAGNLEQGNENVGAFGGNLETGSGNNEAGGENLEGASIVDGNVNPDDEVRGAKE
ncbi:hypothetical protein SESBI_51032 [Sesbania bispinosa]|nr:hypothetical protein SESBI_51032 [Sesbania bispinosa]